MKMILFTPARVAVFGERERSVQWKEHLKERKKK